MPNLLVRLTPTFLKQRAAISQVPSFRSDVLVNQQTSRRFRHDPCSAGLGDSLAVRVLRWRLNSAHEPAQNSAVTPCIEVVVPPLISRAVSPQQPAGGDVSLYSRRRRRSNSIACIVSISQVPRCEAPGAPSYCGRIIILKTWAARPTPRRQYSAFAHANAVGQLRGSAVRCRLATQAELTDEVEWSALEDDFRTFLLGAA